MDDEYRAARRAFIRANHPDRGGDPATFVAGLAELERRRATSAVHTGSGVVRPNTVVPRVVVIDTRQWPRSAVSVLLRRVRRRNPVSRRLR